MYKYDIPYPKKGQMTLKYNGVAINVSKKKDYLINKMNEHRVSICQVDSECPAVQYEIIGVDGNIVFEKNFAKGEKATAKEPYVKVKKDTVNFINKNGFDLIADSKGDILTDEKLLTIIYDYIFINRLPITSSRKVSVQLATYKPTTKDEFIVLKGLGEKLYDKFGDELIEVIMNYLNVDVK